MSWRKMSSFLASEAGQKFSFGVTTVACIGAFCTRYFPHAIFVDTYIDIFRLYNKGFSVPVKKELQERFQKAVEYAEVPEHELKLYEPFMAFGFDIFHAGHSFSKFGCKIGLPINFTYSNVDTIEKSRLRIKGETVQWALPEAKMFLDAVVLTEKAQIYAMASEIKMSQTNKFFFDCILAPTSIMVSYWLGRNMNVKFNFRSKPLGLRIVLYGLSSLLGIGYYCFLKDFAQVYYERKVDEQLKEKDPILKEGGLEFYSKILKRNIALRKLMDTDGPGAYTALGNDVYWVRQRHTPIMHRKLFFEDKEPEEYEKF